MQNRAVSRFSLPQSGQNNPKPSLPAGWRGRGEGSAGHAWPEQRLDAGAQQHDEGEDPECRPQGKRKAGQPARTMMSV